VNVAGVKVILEMERVASADSADEVDEPEVQEMS
jgi:hypothetical protein